jgi:uncharacterized protein YdaU (DUF1376 family)
MSDDLKSPAFQFYARDFLADEHVARMGNVETGIYIRLLCFCWLEGSIPADLEELALMLPRTSGKELEKAWRVVGRCFDPHPTEPGRYVQQRLDRERQKQANRREKARLAGAVGGRTRVQREAEAKQTLEQSLSEGLTQSKQTPSTASASAIASAKATLPDGSSARRAYSNWDDLERDLNLEKISPSIALGAWFVHEGVKAGAIPAHLGMDLFSAGYATSEIADALLASWPLDEIKARAHRFFTRKLVDGANRITAEATLGFLSRHWEWFAEDAVAPGERGAKRGPRGGATGTAGMPRVDLDKLQ